ncbi:MAG: exodeoxyribonuclease V subunit gamma [Thiohalocapsa sp.]
MLRVHHSNRLEILLLLLRQVLATPLRDAFAPEQIVVQNQGMARWLAQQLAIADGIAANLAFPLPASFFWRVFRAWIADLPEHSGYDREQLAWRIYARLPARLGDAAFGELAGYLGGEPRALKRWQLSRRIADLFDQYLVYRPELLLDWEAGREPHWQGKVWQAELWRELSAEIAGPHRARLLAETKAALDAGRGPVAPELLPQRVALFGLSAMAPAQCALLQVLARDCEVHLFVFNPCEEYWADIVDERGETRRRARALAKGLPDPGSLLDLGSPLLAAFGHTGQAFVDQTLELDDDPTEAFVDPGDGTVLSCLQQDILRLRDRRNADPAMRSLLDPGDASLTLHSCHGPLREVQVLHDRLLALFEELGRPALEPRDILVMAPDIDRYAPFVEAVFGAAPPERRIPWTIADRRLGAEEPLLAALSRLLALPLSRVTAPEVLGWLEVPAIARRFALDDQSLARIRTWVQESGVRWGLDARMRGDLGLPGDDANSWAFGMRRLFLGYALPPDQALYEGILPYADLEGGDGVALGALQQFIDQIAHWRQVLARSKNADGWRREIGALLDALFAPDDDEETLLQRIREALEDLAGHATAAGLGARVETGPDVHSDSASDAPDALLEPDIIRACLMDVIDEPAGGHRFLTGSVTFCNMVPMRSIPARVVCLLGMNASDFPRSQRPVGFDLIARHPRRGDRSRRDDDRYLFLEALLSARERLHISYVGRDLRDNASKVPSVVVDELLDVVDRGFILSGDGDPKARLPSSRIVVEHPLQPFSIDCFDALDRRLHSFAEDWLAVALGAAGTEPRPFADGVLAEEPVETIAFEDLTRFLRDPARWFLEQRLRLRLPWDEGEMADSEPFSLDGLERWSIGQQLLAISDTAPVGDALDLLRADGKLPHGVAGDMLFRREAERVARFRTGLDQLAAAPLEPIDLDLVLSDTGVRLQGRLTGITDAGLIGFRLGRLKAKYLLDLWVRHLALNAVAAAGVEQCSTYLTDDDDGLMLTRLSPVDDSLAQLDALARVFVAANRQPQPLFPESSYAWAEHQDMGKVLGVWEDAYPDRAGEGSALPVSIAFRGHPNPLDQRFQRLSERVFGPLLAVRSQGQAGVGI